MDKIFRDNGGLTELINKLKKEKKIIVFTNGVFDIIHRGHVEYLNQAKKLGDVLIVGINSDSSVKKIKGEDRPIIGESDRAFVLVNLKAVDFVVIFQEDNPYNLIKNILPDVLVKGGDWKEKNIIGSEIVLNSGGKVISLNYVDNYSTSSIIDTVQKKSET
ncbi:MAG: D-glycero-beta-D-manno-heptose 1-phosphate adenylyltransferase [Ignavibacteria bacterium]